MLAGAGELVVASALDPATLAAEAKNADIVISEKDARLPFLKSFVSPFPYNGDPLAELTSSDSV